MGYYASGDTRKTTQTSEDDEGYENQSSNTSGPVATISDDTDRPFWAEDESSSAESRQQLNEKQKRRRSSSYRDRIAVRRSRSLLFQSSSSSLDSTSERISPGDIDDYALNGQTRAPSYMHDDAYTFNVIITVSKQERLTTTSRFSVKQAGHGKTKKINSRKKGMSSLSNTADRISCTEYKNKFNQKETRKQRPLLTNKKFRRQ